MRLGVRTLVSLSLCAAAAAAAAAHVVIDVVGDYALPHDTYDNIAHSSRDLVTGVAVLLACVLAGRGLRICCDIAAAYRTRLPQPAVRASEIAGMLAGAIAVTVATVPAMEWLDGRLDGVPVKELDDAFGGSTILGVTTAVVCAVVLAGLVYALARWLVSHRDDIVAIIETLLCREDATARPCGDVLERHLFSPRRRRTAHALRLCKRGPPGNAHAQRHYHFTSTEGDSREIRSRSRDARARCARGHAWIRRAGLRGDDPSPARGAYRQHRWHRRRCG